MDFDISKSVAILRRTPSVLQSLLSELPKEWTQNDYGPDTWSVHQVVGHLIWGERTDWMVRARQILDHGDSDAFEPFDREGHGALCEQHSLQELLRIFAEERADNVVALEELELSRSDLEKKGRHPALGTVTLAELLATWTVHDLNHIGQICKAMAFQYKSEVGSWEAYISILAPPNPK